MKTPEKIKKLQAKIRTMKDINQDAESLIEKINRESEEIKESTENDLVELRKQIRKDIAELKSFSDPNNCTKSLTRWLSLGFEFRYQSMHLNKVALFV